MLGAKFWLLVLIGQAQGVEADPAALVAQLGAGRYTEREAASKALEQLGRPALAALRAVRDTRDPEIRTRAAHLVQKIEGALLTQPSRVRLDFDNAPLTQVVQTLSQQVGFKVTLYPENLSKWRTQRVTLHQSEPVPFWKAIDQLCEAAQLQHNPSVHVGVGPREPTFPLTDSTMRPIMPSSDDGPFRVSLMSLDYERHLSYAVVGAGIRPQLGRNPMNPAGRRPQAAAPARPNPMMTEQFTAHLVVTAEPRLSLSQSGAIQVIEAEDDLGHSLVASGKAAPVFNRYAGYFGVLNGSVMQLQVPLDRPETAGARIKKLRGVIPLTVSSRRPDPLIVPLNQGVGKRFENADVELTVHEIRSVPASRQTLIELSINPKERATTADLAEPDAFNAVYRPDTQRLQLEVIDPRGRVIPWFLSVVNSETSRVTLTLTNVPAPAALKELRYHTLTRATINVPFEFDDIPMP
jgi:hypothetical protein